MFGIVGAPKKISDSHAVPGNVAIGVQIILFIFGGSPQPFDKTSSRDASSPSIEMAILVSFNTWAKVMDVNRPP